VAEHTQALASGGAKKTDIIEATKIMALQSHEDNGVAKPQRGDSILRTVKDCAFD
jgi:hypothetical protein